MWLINTENLLHLVWQTHGDMLEQATKVFLLDNAPHDSSSPHNTTSAKILERATSETAPSYAILSHTWPPEGSALEEVSFEEITAPTLSASTLASWGFAKILKTCEIAFMKHHLRHAWVDTCCIDKSSSSELSESINSMFKWYRQAELCIAFLDDLEPLNDDATSTETVTDQLESCRWFTRGWTLQELIAPQRLEVYDRTWTLVADRTNLADAISNICGVSTGILRGRDYLHETPVCVRMSWAAKRKTTRKEDEAYCLLGIFDVNMPMLYGEGPKAFFRLQEEIIKDNPDMSIFAWIDRQPEFLYSGLFASSPAMFDGMGDAVRLPNAASDIFDFSSTNRGVKIQARLGFSRLSGYAFLSIGHNWIHSPYLEKLAITLRQVGPDSFVRVHKPLVAPQNDTLDSIKSVLIPKYLTRQQAWRTENRVMQIMQPEDPYEHPDFRLADIEPPGCWDSSTSTFFSGYLDSFVGYLHFRPDWADEFDSFVLVCWHTAVYHPAHAVMGWRYDLLPGDHWAKIKPDYLDHYRASTVLEGPRLPKALRLPHLYDESKSKLVVLESDDGHRLHFQRSALSLKIVHAPSRNDLARYFDDYCGDG